MTAAQRRARDVGFPGGDTSGAPCCRERAHQDEDPRQDDVHRAWDVWRRLGAQVPPPLKTTARLVPGVPTRGSAPVMRMTLSNASSQQSKTHPKLREVSADRRQQQGASAHSVRPCSSTRTRSPSGDSRALCRRMLSGLRRGGAGVPHQSQKRSCQATQVRLQLPMTATARTQPPDVP